VGVQPPSSTVSSSSGTLSAQPCAGTPALVSRYHVWCAAGPHAHAHHTDTVRPCRHPVWERTREPDVRGVGLRTTTAAD
jgi:hypothetical protein